MAAFAAPLLPMGLPQPRISPLYCLPPPPHPAAAPPSRKTTCLPSPKGEGFVQDLGPQHKLSYQDQAMSHHQCGWRWSILLVLSPINLKHTWRYLVNELCSVVLSSYLVWSTRILTSRGFILEFIIGPMNIVHQLSNVMHVYHFFENAMISILSQIDIRYHVGIGIKLIYKVSEQKWDSKYTNI